MVVNIHTDNHIDLKADSVKQLQTDIAASLKRFSDWLTRLEIHLTDENS